MSGAGLSAALLTVAEMGKDPWGGLLNESMLGLPLTKGVMMLDLGNNTDGFIGLIGLARGLLNNDFIRILDSAVLYPIVSYPLSLASVRGFYASFSLAVKPA